MTAAVTGQLLIVICSFLHRKTTQLEMSSEWLALLHLSIPPGNMKRNMRRKFYLPILVTSM
jgi:hypothetical protein